MNTPNEDRKPTDNMDLLKQQALGCGPECGCHTTETPAKKRWVIGAIVLAAAGVLVVRAMIKNDGASSQAAAPAFASLAASQTPASESGPAKNSGAPVPSVEPRVGTSIEALSELNGVAAKTDAIFIFLPGKESASGNPPLIAMKGAARTIESSGLKCGFFVLKAGSADYDRIAAEMTVPGVMVMLKKGGVSTVSGEITATKLVQGYVAASSAGACGPSAGAGCCP